MSESIVCKPSPVKTLSVSRAPLRELLNFLVYASRPGLLNERARRQPSLSLEKVPSNVRELKDFLGAKRCDKNEKFFFDCVKPENHILIRLNFRSVEKNLCGFSKER